MAFLFQDNDMLKHIYETIKAHKRDFGSLDFVWKQYSKNGDKEPYRQLMSTLALGLHTTVDIDRVLQCLPEKVGEMSMDAFYREQASKINDMVQMDNHYGTLAGRLMFTTLHQSENIKPFSEFSRMLHGNIHPKTGKWAPLMSSEIWVIVDKHKKEFDRIIKPWYDYKLNFLAFRALETTYAHHINHHVVETVQHLFLRFALSVRRDNIAEVISVYENLANFKYTHGTPALYNACMGKNQQSSCFLMEMRSDSIEGIYDTIKWAAMISKEGGGEGIEIGNIRSQGAPIIGSNGRSNGIIPMLTVLNSTAAYVDQCFTGDTLIPTERGLIPIADIIDSTQEGQQADKVWTKDEQYCIVRNLVKHESKNRDMYNIATFNDPQHRVRVTPDHLFMTLAMKDNATVRNVFEAMTSKDSNAIQWLPLSKGSKNDFLLFKTFGSKSLKHEEESWAKLAGYIQHYDYLLENDNQTVIRFPKNEMGIQLLKSNKVDFEESESTLNVTITPVLHQWMGTNGWKNIISILRHAKNGLLIREFAESLSSRSQCIVVQDDKLEDVKSMLSMAGLPHRVSLQQGNSLYYIAYTTNTTIKSNIVAFEDEIGRGLLTQFAYDGWYGVQVVDLQMYETSDTVYDLVIDHKHNYQTSAGLAHNGGGKRKGAFAIYLPHWHADTMSFLHIRTSTDGGDEDLKCRHLFPAFMMQDPFFKRLFEDGQWSLFCPTNARKLRKLWGEEFEEEYTAMEEKKMYVKQIRAAEFWNELIRAEFEIGMPFMAFATNINHCSNQQNIGPIVTSNLCTEIVEFTQSQQLDNNAIDEDIKDECAVCTLGSMILPAYVYQAEDGTKQYDWDSFATCIREMVGSMDRLIDYTHYPLEAAKYSNLRRRPIGIGIQGKYDCCSMMEMCLDDPEAVDFSTRIFETMDFVSLDESCNLAKVKGVYEGYEGSPISKGIFHYDMCVSLRKLKIKQFPKEMEQFGLAVRDKNGELNPADIPERTLDWDALRNKILKHGVRHSLRIAPMPTAGTTTLSGATEMGDAPSALASTRKLLSGEYFVWNESLVYVLYEKGLWTPEIIKEIVSNNGVNGLDKIPEKIRHIFRNAYELNPMVKVQSAAHCQFFIDQAQSFNSYIPMKDNTDPNEQEHVASLLSSMYIYGFLAGLKTFYYTRILTEGAAKYTLGKDHFIGGTILEMAKQAKKASDGPVCRRDNPDCIACSG